MIGDRGRVRRRGSPTGPLFDLAGARFRGKLGVCDHIIGEPLGGAQRDKSATIEAVGKAITNLLNEIGTPSREEVIANRRRKFLDLGSKGLAA